MTKNDILFTRSAKIDILTRYTKYLQEHGYIDTDATEEEPFAIDDFLDKDTLGKKVDALDIEKEGFVFKYQDASGTFPVKAYTKPYKNHPKGYVNQHIDVLHIDRDNWVLICQGGDETPYTDWETMFCGNVQTQDEFKMVLRMVII